MNVPNTKISSVSATPEHLASIPPNTINGLLADVERLKGLIALAECVEGHDDENCRRYCPDALLHAEARAIKARQK